MVVMQDLYHQQQGVGFRLQGLRGGACRRPCSEALGFFGASGLRVSGGFREKGLLKGLGFGLHSQILNP